MRLLVLLPTLFAVAVPVASEGVKVSAFTNKDCAGPSAQQVNERSVGKCHLATNIECWKLENTGKFTLNWFDDENCQGDTDNPSLDYSGGYGSPGGTATKEYLLKNGHSNTWKGTDIRSWKVVRKLTLLNEPDNLGRAQS